MEELDRQKNNLIKLGYAALAGLDEAEFAGHLDSLARDIEDLDYPKEIDEGKIPFLVVVKIKKDLAERAMAGVTRQGKPGVTKLFPFQPGDFNTIQSVTLPDKPVYLLIEVDRGAEFLNVTPEKALETIKSRGRSPLTIDEGIAIMTHFPDFLQKNNCFSLLASRHPGSQHVPAIWINAKKQPNLGWCWDRNPHTWLGSASCLRRI